MKPTLLLVVLMTFGSVSHATGFTERHRVYSGDLNSDGKTDYLVVEPPKIVFVSVGEISTPIVFEKASQIVLQRLANQSGFTLVENITPAQRSFFSSTASTTIDSVTVDLNADDADDLVLDGFQGLSSGIDGAILYATSLSTGAGVQYVPIGPAFDKFWTELYKWMPWPSYFDDEAPTRLETRDYTYVGYHPSLIVPLPCQSYYGYSYVYGDINNPNYDNPTIQNVYHYWCFNFLAQPIEVPDYSVFSPLALDVAFRFGSVDTVEQSSQSAEYVLADIEQVLGVPYGPANAFVVPPSVVEKILVDAGVIVIDSQGLRYLSVVRLLNIATAIVLLRSDTPDPTLHVKHYTTDARYGGIVLASRIESFSQPPQLPLVYFTHDTYFERLLARDRLALCIVPEGFLLFNTEDIPTLGPESVVQPFTCADGYTRPGKGKQRTAPAPVALPPPGRHRYIRISSIN